MNTVDLSFPVFSPSPLPVDHGCLLYAALCRTLAYPAAADVDGTFGFGDKTGGGDQIQGTVRVGTDPPIGLKMAISEKVTHLRKKLLKKLLTNSDHLGRFGINGDHLNPEKPTKKARISVFSADWAWLEWAILDSNQ